MKIYTLLLLVCTSHFILTQIIEGDIYLNDHQQECKKSNDPKTRISVNKVLKNTYIISEAKKYPIPGEAKWLLNPFYEELTLASEKNSFYTRKVYEKNCGTGLYYEHNKNKIIANKNGSLYDVEIFNFRGDLVKKGRSKYIYPPIWDGVVLTYYKNGIVKTKYVYSENKLNSKTYFSETGKELKEVIDVDKVDEKPKFKASDNDFLADFKAFAATHLVYPLEARENCLMGEVYLTFIVTSDGEVACIEVIKGINSLLDEQAVTLINSLPQLKPGEVNGIPVHTKVIVPIFFSN